MKFLFFLKFANIYTTSVVFDFPTQRYELEKQF